MLAFIKCWKVGCLGLGVGGCMGPCVWMSDTWRLCGVYWVLEWSVIQVIGKPLLLFQNPRGLNLVGKPFTNLGRFFFYSLVLHVFDINFCSKYLVYVLSKQCSS